MPWLRRRRSTGLQGRAVRHMTTHTKYPKGVKKVCMGAYHRLRSNRMVPLATASSPICGLWGWLFKHMRPRPVLNENCFFADGITGSAQARPAHTAASSSCCTGAQPRWQP